MQETIWLQAAIFNFGKMLIFRHLGACSLDQIWGRVSKHYQNIDRVSLKKSITVVVGYLSKAQSDTHIQDIWADLTPFPGLIGLTLFITWGGGGSLTPQNLYLAITIKNQLVWSNVNCLFFKSLPPGHFGESFIYLCNQYFKPKPQPQS